MEAFAFLTAKLRLKQEDDLPELTHPMLQLLWPNYLRPSTCEPSAPSSRSPMKSSMDWLIKGQPIRGLRTRLKLDQRAFLCEGDLYLFGCVLAHFFALYASINSFQQLEVINTTNNEHYTWPIQTGKQPLI